jgi:hypothetical protein
LTVYQEYRNNCCRTGISGMVPPACHREEFNYVHVSPKEGNRMKRDLRFLCESYLDQ